MSPSDVTGRPTPESCPQEFQHDWFRPEVFKFCPECGTDIVEWQRATAKLRADLAAAPPEAPTDKGET